VDGQNNNNFYNNNNARVSDAGRGATGKSVGSKNGGGVGGVPKLELDRGGSDPVNARVEKENLMAGSSR
jgi:hypothetical protein